MLPLFAFIFVMMSFVNDAYAVTGNDRVPGAPCSVDKSVTLTANPGGVGGYVLTCEGGQWVATISAQIPTEPDQVATKRYIDDYVVTIETHVYKDIMRYTDQGNLRPLVISALETGQHARVASYLCSDMSGGQYVLGKFIDLQYIHSGYDHDSTGDIFRCEGACITGSSGKTYAWTVAGDYVSPDGFYQNYSSGWGMPSNAPEMATNTCASFVNGDHGTMHINGECMAGATNSRPTIAGITAASYLWGTFLVKELLCWAN